MHAVAERGDHVGGSDAVSAGRRRPGGAMDVANKSSGDRAKYPGTRPVSIASAQWRSRQREVEGGIGRCNHSANPQRADHGVPAMRLLMTLRRAAYSPAREHGRRMACEGHVDEGRHVLARSGCHVLRWSTIFGRSVRDPLHCADSARAPCSPCSPFVAHWTFALAGPRWATWARRKQSEGHATTFAEMTIKKAVRRSRAALGYKHAKVIFAVRFECGADGLHVAHVA